MLKRSPSFSRRAWSLVRLTLLWARKGSLFRRRLMVELRLVPKLIRSIGHIGNPRRDQIGRYMRERELSFDETPVVHVKMHRPHSMRFLLAPYIPCINPQIDFDCDFEGDGAEGTYGWESSDIALRRSFIEDAGLECGQAGDDEAEEGEGIDRRAEEFIARFYEQMKLQRQISLLQYNQ